MITLLHLKVVTHFPCQFSHSGGQCAEARGHTFSLLMKRSCTYSRKPAITGAASVSQWNTWHHYQQLVMPVLVITPDTLTGGIIKGPPNFPLISSLFCLIAGVFLSHHVCLQILSPGVRPASSPPPFRVPCQSSSAGAWHMFSQSVCNPFPSPSSSPGSCWLLLCPEISIADPVQAFIVKDLFILILGLITWKQHWL